MMAQVSSEMLPQEVTTVTELMSYLWRVHGYLCRLAPATNVPARAA